MVSLVISSSTVQAKYSHEKIVDGDQVSEKFCGFKITTKLMKLNQPQKFLHIYTLSEKSPFLLSWFCLGNFGIEITILHHTLQMM